MSWREFVGWGRFFHEKAEEQKAKDGGTDEDDEVEDTVNPEEMTAIDVARIFGVRVPTQ